MNEKQPIYIIVGLFSLIFILFVIFVSVYLTPKEPVSLHPRAEEVTHRLGFHVAHNDKPTVQNEVALAPGTKFSLLIMLSKGASLEQNKKYKFHLKFDYNGEVLTLPFGNRKLNDSEVRNMSMISTDSIFTETEFNKVEEQNGKIEIEGFFKSSNSYTDFVEKEGVRNNDRVVIVKLSNFEVKKDAVLDETTVLFKWYRDGETKVSRVDATIVNPDKDLQLELVDKNKGDIKVSETPPKTGGISPQPNNGGTDQTSQTPQTTGAITLNLSLKFQGILKKPDTQYNSMSVKISIAGGTLLPALPPQIGTFMSDDQGVWTGLVSFSSIPAGSNYRVLVKGPKHLQKRICDTNPSETYPGSYTCHEGKIDLRTGVNTLDFSKIYQLAGDLAEQSGAQNGFTNSYDTSLIRNNLNSTDPNILKLADLNLDGIVNTQDFSLAIAALEFRTDEL